MGGGRALSPSRRRRDAYPLAPAFTQRQSRATGGDGTTPGSARPSLTIMHVRRAVDVHAQRKVVELERTIGLDKARGKLGQLAEEVRAANAPVVLMRRGEPLAVLVSPAEYERLTAADRRELSSRADAEESGVQPRPVSQRRKASIVHRGASETLRQLSARADAELGIGA